MVPPPLWLRVSAAEAFLTGKYFDRSSLGCSGVAFPQFIASAAEGNTFPGATLRFGMIPGGPHTRLNGWHHQGDQTMRGLTLTSSVGLFDSLARGIRKLSTGIDGYCGLVALHRDVTLVQQIVHFSCVHGGLLRDLRIGFGDFRDQIVSRGRLGIILLAAPEIAESHRGNLVVQPRVPSAAAVLPHAPVNRFRLAQISLLPKQVALFHGKQDIVRITRLE